METLKLLSKIALSFQNLNDFEEEMKKVLKDIGEFTDASRMYVFLKEQNLVSNKYEWCNEGIEPQIENLQNLEFNKFSSWFDIFKSYDYICASDISELPREISKQLKIQNIKSIISYPLIIEKEIIGFIGLDQCTHNRTWTEEECHILCTVSNIISNIYEKRLFQKNIVNSEANFYNFFKTIDDMLIVCDLNGNIIYSNQLLIDKLGFSLCELKNTNILNLHPKDLREEAYDLWASMLKGERESCSMRLEGKYENTYEVESKLWFGTWNDSECVYVILKDLTIQNENINLASKIFDNNPMPMSITDVREEVLVEINPAFTEKTGYRREDVIGKTFDELDIFENTENLYSIWESAKKYKKIENKELIVKCRDGSFLTVIFSMEAIINEGRQSFLTVMVDITEKVELLKSVEDKCIKLNNIIEGTHLATWEWNIETREIKFNQQAANIIGCKLEQLENITIDMWSEFSHPKDLENSKMLLEEHLNGKTEYYECEARIKQKDNTWLWVQIRGKIIYRDEVGNASKMFGTFFDITSRKHAERDLKESEKRFFLALDETNAGLWDFNLISGDVFLSPMWKSILGYEDYEIENSYKAWQDLWHPDDREDIHKASEDYLEGKTKNYKNIHRLKHKDGSWRWILSQGGILRTKKGKPYRWIGTNMDITKEHEQSLELERIFSVNLDLLCIIDSSGNFIKVNKAWEDILGYDIENLIGLSILDFIHKDDRESTVKVVENLNEDKKITSFINRYKNKEGKYIYLEWRANPYGDMIYASGRDITERIEYEKKILEISYRDSLTDAYNRRYVFNRAKELVEESKRTGKLFSVCIIDIDHFKDINDSFGHQMGDFILKEFTEIISKNLRPYDILGRYGGEEFILLLNNIDKEKSNIVVERILSSIREKSFKCGNFEIKLTFSAGISNSDEVEKSELSIDKLVEIADERMYHAKITGRNRIVLKIA